MKLIDADKLEPHEIYEDNGFTEVVYMDDIREMPTVDAEPIRHGYWEAHAVSIKGVPTEVCSVCGEWTYGDCVRFCPNCGAKMDEEVEE